MNMGFENVRDGDTSLAGHLDINIYIRSGIENGGGALIIIADQVGQFGDAFSLNGLKNK